MRRLGSFWAALRRLVQTAVGDRLAKKALLGGDIRDGDTVLVDRPAAGA